MYRQLAYIRITHSNDYVFTPYSNTWHHMKPSNNSTTEIIMWMVMPCCTNESAKTQLQPRHNTSSHQKSRSELNALIQPWIYPIMNSLNRRFYLRALARTITCDYISCFVPHRYACVLIKCENIFHVVIVNSSYLKLVCKSINRITMHWKWCFIVISKNKLKRIQNLGSSAY